jgi:hypothetical protein
VLADAAPALLVALPALASVWPAAVRASWASLGRDQGIFQYVAWAIGQGDLAYRDVRDVNGPVIPMVHAAFQALGGADEHRFRLLDLIVSGVVFAVAGLCLPSLVRARPSLAYRAAWAVAAWAALTAQYVVYGFWDTAQRESFLDWFVVLSMSIQATGAAVGPKRRGASLLLMTAGAASFLPWLGKPTYALFTASQLVALAIESDPVRIRARRLATFVAGGLAGMAAPLAFILRHGDVRAWLRITIVDVPTMYRFIWPSPPDVILRLPGYGTMALLAAATTVGIIALIALGRLPRRAVPLAAMPILGLASALIQAKGFPYHFHPVTLGTSLGWLVALAAVWGEMRPRAAILRGGVLVLAMGVGVRAFLLGRAAPDPPEPPEAARDREALESAARLAAFDRIDFFPRALRDAAAYIAKTTEPDERVQTYGMDAYLLFLAGRRSATPYIYSYDLNADAALVGSYSPDGPHPSEDQRALIRAMRDEHERDLLSRLEQRPPAAFVFVDRSPLMSSQDAVEDFRAHCAATMAWLEGRYREAADFDGIRVWLPRARLPAAPPPSSE